MTNLKVVENTLDKETTMTTLEIAELTEKRHDHVLRDTEKMFDALEIAAPKFGVCYKDSNNRERKMYKLNNELTTTLVSGYSIKMRNAIVKRWHELEAKQPKLTQLEMLAQGFAKMAEIENSQSKIVSMQSDQDKRISAIEDRQDSMDGDTQYMTALAYCRLKNISAPLSVATPLGRSCSKFCKENDIVIGAVPDERWGSVNSYPVEVLDMFI